MCHTIHIITLHACKGNEKLQQFILQQITFLSEMRLVSDVLPNQMISNNSIMFDSVMCIYQNKNLKINALKLITINKSSSISSVLEVETDIYFGTFTCQN